MSSSCSVVRRLAREANDLGMASPAVHPESLAEGWRQNYAPNCRRRGGSLPDPLRSSRSVPAIVSVPLPDLVHPRSRASWRSASSAQRVVVADHLRLHQPADDPTCAITFQQETHVEPGPYCLRGYRGRPLVQPLSREAMSGSLPARAAAGSLQTQVIMLTHASWNQTL